MESQTTRSAFEERRAARAERYRRYAEKAHGQGSTLLDKADRMGAALPFGQPILIGHHSEHRDRRYRERIQNAIRQGFVEHGRGDYWERRAEAVENDRAIYSDDPEALEKLRAQLQAAEERHEKMKAANRALRQGDDHALVALGLSAAMIATLKEPDYAGRTGYPDYSITNNGANIRRLRKRIAELEAAASDTTTEEAINGVTITDDVDDGRVRMKFPRRLTAEECRAMRGHGFVWSRMNQAWQRKRSNAARYWAGEIARGFIE